MFAFCTQVGVQDLKFLLVTLNVLHGLKRHSFELLRKYISALIFFDVLFAENPKPKHYVISAELKFTALRNRQTFETYLKAT